MLTLEGRGDTPYEDILWLINPKYTEDIRKENLLEIDIDSRGQDPKKQKVANELSKINFEIMAETSPYKDNILKIQKSFWKLRKKLLDQIGGSWYRLERKKKGEIKSVKNTFAILRAGASWHELDHKVVESYDGREYWSMKIRGKESSKRIIDFCFDHQNVQDGWDSAPGDAYAKILFDGWCYVPGFSGPKDIPKNWRNEQ